MRFGAFIITLAVLAGCTTPRTEVLSVTGSYPPKLEVELLLDPPKRPHKTFALLEDRYGGTPEEINARLIQTGRDLGADAVLITGIKDETSTDWIPVGSYYFRDRWMGTRYEPVQYRYRSVRAKALKYLSPS
jgi:hypothetical protein